MASFIVKPLAEAIAKRHVMDACTNVQCTFTFHNLCYRYHVIGSEAIVIYRAQFHTLCHYCEIQNRKKRSNTLPDSEVEPETPCKAVALSTT
ncbi:hypothetical protein SFRURICE_010678 [Spodoptera frugiperda]|nr:hypothetical protein SFRURICE_010678 [Spodoptera frugiperda]